MKSALLLGCNLHIFSPETSALCLGLSVWFRKSQLPCVLAISTTIMSIYFQARRLQVWVEGAGC